MAVEQTSGLEDLLMGNVSEGSEETSEQIAARITAAQARLASVKKDEQKTSGDDRHLAKIIPYLEPALLKVVAWMVNHEIPSLTILAFLSIASVPAADIIVSQVLISDPQEYSFLKDFDNKGIQNSLAEWMNRVEAADKQSKTVRLSALHSKGAESTQLVQNIRIILSVFWFRPTTEYESKLLDKVARSMVERF